MLQVEKTSTQTPRKIVSTRWNTQRGWVSLLAFLIISVLIEYFIVLYAINLGVEETSQSLLKLQIPGINWTIEISPLFHIVPAVVVIVLATVWTNFTKRATIRTVQPQKWKAGTSLRQDKRSIAKEQKKQPTGIKQGVFGTTARNMLIVLLIFSVLILVVSLLAYPNLIYWIVTDAYQNNPSLLNFVKSTGQGLASIGGVFSAINGALIAASPGLRGLALSLGGLIRPVASMDNVGKYLLFQNGAAWISAIITLVYGKYGSHLHKKR